MALDLPSQDLCVTSVTSPPKYFMTSLPNYPQRPSHRLRSSDQERTLTGPGHWVPSGPELYRKRRGGGDGLQQDLVASQRDLGASRPSPGGLRVGSRAERVWVGTLSQSVATEALLPPTRACTAPHCANSGCAEGEHTLWPSPHPAISISGSFPGHRAPNKHPGQGQPWWCLQAPVHPA